jgi:hypothetical protein
MEPKFSTLTFYLSGFEVTIIIWGITAVIIELLPPETGVGEVAMIMRCHHSIIDCPRTRDCRERKLAFVNITPDSLNCKLAVRRDPGAGAMRARPNASGLKFRFRASPSFDLLDSFDANQNSKNSNDPLVSCIDAERAAI